AGNEDDPESKVQVSKNELTLNKRKKNFFRQRALDKLFCKSVINKNFATETEILKALEEQLIHFTRTFEIRLIKDILVDHSIISQLQAATIATAIAQPGSAPIAQPGSVSTESQASVMPEDGVEAISSQPQDYKKSITIGDNNEFELTIDAEEIEATIQLTGDMPEDMTVDQLKELLSRHKIIYGLVDEVSIELFLRRAGAKKEKLSNEKRELGIEEKNLSPEKEEVAVETKRLSPEREDNLIIAQGRPVKPGRNAFIKYLFENENENFGKELASGKFDYRERGQISNIAKGSIVAEKIPLIPAVKGFTVFGTEICAPEPVDVNLNCGQGVELSKDGLKAVATANGRPDLSLGGKISIMPGKIVKGNVDFKTGNIKFNGDIVVQGSILAGFSVTGSNLTVNEIEEAEVDLANNLIVKNSINSSTIKTGGNIAAQIVKRSTIFSRGDVAVQKEIIDCTIITSGRVMVPRGRVISSKIYAAKGIEAMNIGSEVSTPCQLFPGSDDYAEKILNLFSEKIDSQKALLAKFEAIEEHYDKKSLQQLNDLSEISRLQERFALDKKKALEDKNIATSPIVKKQMDSFLADLDKRALKMDETVNKMFDEHDSLVSKNTEIKIKIKSIKNELQDLLNEKKGFETWYESQKQEARKKGEYVQVQGTLSSGTQITGTHCSMTTKSNIKNSRIKQVANIGDPLKPSHQMIVEPLSSKGKMHS
ncbi:MAG: DUF342 domain-containing protein, partial [Desulfamplus sp.]|nr:DUF342 domain-containing protein [Desulfamplus sp.]